MKLRATILFLAAALILVFFNACSVAKTSETVTITVTTTETTSSADQQYYKEMGRISNALTDATSTYYQACDDFINFDIDLLGHKKATDNFVVTILLLISSYEKLEPPENYVTVHNLFGTSLEHFNNSAMYLSKYVKSNGDDMNTYLEKAISDIKEAAKYLGKANEEIKNMN